MGILLRELQWEVIYVLGLHCWVKARLNMLSQKKKMNSCLILSCKKKRGLDSTLTLVVNQIFIDIFLNDFVVD